MLDTEHVTAIMGQQTTAALRCWGRPWAFLRSPLRRFIPADEPIHVSFLGNSGQVQ